MKTLLKGILVLLGFFVLATIAGLWLCLEDYPLIETQGHLGSQEVRRVRWFLAQHDPQFLRDGEVKTLKVSDHDLQILSMYFMEFVGGGGAKIRVDYGSLKAQFTFPFTRQSQGPFLNVELVMTQSQELPMVESLLIGQMQVPSAIADGIFQKLINKVHVNSEHRWGKGLIQDMSITNHGISLTYKWDAQIAESIQETMIPEDEQQRLRAYHFKLVELMDQLPLRRRHSLVEVMAPLFHLAHERSKDGDPVLENRAAILVLAASAGELGIRRLVPTAKDWPLPKRKMVALRGRVDWAQHFIFSAALTLMGGQAISEAIGLFKEMEDSRSGSGFSFADLAADKAGTRFGTYATTVGKARHLQGRFATGIREGDLIPNLRGLPEWMSEREWKRRFGGLDSPKYQRMIEEIDRQLERLPLYQKTTIQASL